MKSWPAGSDPLIGNAGGSLPQESLSPSLSVPLPLSSFSKLGYFHNETFTIIAVLKGLWGGDVPSSII